MQSWMLLYPKDEALFTWKKRKSGLRDFEAEYSSLTFCSSLLLIAEYRNRQQTWTLIY